VPARNATAITPSTTTATVTGSKETRVSPGRSARIEDASTSCTTAPTPIAAIVPIRLPSRPITTASMLNSANTRGLDSPIAFIRPTSRVRSCTAMNSVLMMPIDAASRAMIAKPLSTSTIVSITEVIAPSWSSSVVPVYPASASRSWRAAVASSPASASNHTDAEA
jgi:hypothetical protein